MEYEFSKENFDKIMDEFVKLNTDLKRSKIIEEIKFLIAYQSKLCMLNNSDFEVNLGRFFYEHSYSDKFMSVDEGGIGYGSVEVSGPQISPYRDGSLSFRVSLDVFDKKSWTKIDSEHIRVNVEDHKGSSKSYGREELEFYLEPGEYVISINEAICEY